MGAFGLANLAVKLVVGTVWMIGQVVYGTIRFAWRWPWTFLLITALMSAGCYAMAGEKTP